ncbi:MAG: Tim44/TimA family putative adaptor protein [Alphaproteobacteria bacterium]
MDSLIEIVVFAMIAAFLVYRLRSVLGRRTGTERPPVDPFARGNGTRRPAPRETRDDDKVVALPDRTQPAAAPSEPSAPAPSGPAAAGLTQVQIADPSFDPARFLEGARSAFEMIVASFAAGDRDTLRPLLSNEVFENFAGAIAAREKAGEVLETTLVGVRDTEITEASVEARVAYVTVKFVTEQINVTRDAEGKPVDGDPGKVATVTDVWTFARNTRSRNPNWTLVATATPE